MLTVSHLTKHYGHVAALSDVSFSIRPGEVLGLIGPNGSGKTTLFECLAGVQPADAGMLLRDGEPVSVRDRSSVLFYMPDGIAPWAHQTVGWVLRYAEGFFGGPPPGEWADVFERLDLESLVDVRVGELSKGQRKRVLLAIGLLTPQPVLLADEPFDGLDLRQTREVGGALRLYAATGRTLFLSIHQISDAARFCDRFVLLSEGRVCGEGTLDEITGRAKTNTLEDAFLALT
ncbi:MAG TPA: ABC transporter ATP-binding protein [Vicinamibacterales bacterium]|nr:ABC transporter ATP-binding protein [Vicinamibacterales bacterium]